MRTRTLTDHIYESLRDDILELRLRPGEKLSEVKLAERYGVSRAPIRNVIARLEQAKLVVVRPQIGTLISPISFEKLLDILEVRLLLEPQAAAAAAERIDAGDLELLDEAFRRFEKETADSEAGRKAHFETDALLHRTVWKWCGNAEIAHILESYRGEIYRIRISNSELAHRLVPTAAEMRVIYQAIRSHSAEEAREAMRRHVFNTRQTVAGLLETLRAGESVRQAP